MAVWLYNLLTRGYFASIKIASFFSGKARLWVEGRRGIFNRLENDFSKRDATRPLLWMHCASLGEFEQGRTVLEALRKERPGLQILLTFFSPSGYEVRKNYPLADWVYYLPADTAANARKFLNTVQPSMAIFVKYEFWYHYLTALSQKRIPVFLIAAIFRRKHPFFQCYGSLHREMLTCFTKIFVQDKSSFDLVSTITKTTLVLAGDTRVDRVVEIARLPSNLPAVEVFCGDSPVLVCGSTWPEDEKLIHHFTQSPAYQHWKIILAPHDVQSARIHALEKQFQGMTIRYSEAEKQAGQGRGEQRILLIDNIGMLSKLYRFGNLAYIGGGFGIGIHNTLEAIAYGIPVIFGPNYGKFAEAIWLVRNGGGFSVVGEKGFMEVFEKLQVAEFYGQSSEMASKYLSNSVGATRRVVNEILQE